MKNILKVLLVLLVIAAVLIFTFGCNESSGKVSDATINNYNDYIGQASKEFKKFMEKYELANNTSRINLSSILSEMQNIKANFEDIEAPDEINSAKDIYIEGMDLIIEGFMSFQSEKSQVEVVGIFNQAELKLDSAESMVSQFDEEGLFKESRVQIKHEVKTANVKYIVIGMVLNEVDAVYTDENGQLVEQVGLELKLRPSEALKGITTSLRELYSEDSDFFDNIANAAIVEEIENFPLDYKISFGALHNDVGIEMITVLVAINNMEWKVKTENVGQAVPVSIDEKYME